MFFEHQPKFGQKGSKTIIFTFCKTLVITKNPFCCNPPVDQKLVFLKLPLLKETTFTLNQSLTLNRETNKDKEKGFERKRRQKTKKDRKDWWKTNFKVKYFGVALFIKAKQRNKKKKERDKNREPEESKTRKKRRRRERQRKIKVKKEEEND